MSKSLLPHPDPHSTRDPVYISVMRMIVNSLGVLRKPVNLEDIKDKG